MLIKMRDIERTVTLPDGEDLTILRGLELDVDRGDYVSVVGRSGTGKSTLLNLLGLLDRPSSGTYEFDGTEVTTKSDRKLSALRGADIGFVFQQFNLFHSRTVVENVAMPLTYAEGQDFWQRFDRAAEMLDAVGLGDRLDESPQQLSGGEQQRVAIARALVRTPKLILADEPTGALDPQTGTRIMDLLVKKAEETNAALLIITHDMAIAQHARQRYELRDGRLHELADAEAPAVAGGVHA